MAKFHRTYLKNQAYTHMWQFTATRYTFVVNSHPADAKLVITDKKGREVFNGNTPATVRIKSSAGYFSPGQYTVKFTKPGFE